MMKNNGALYSWVLAVALFLGTPAGVYAQVVDPLIEGAKLCTRHLQRYETEYGIPQHLLSAIASTESGRFHERLKIKLPWPWTINAKGKGYFYNSKEEAVEAARKFLARGVESIDIGCMQVNIHHHPNAFSSLEQGFEPEYNVAYAASFLRNLYQEDGSWRKAASDYHSKTPQLGTQYVGLVYNSWLQILDKLRAARLNMPSSSVAALHDMQQAKLNTVSPKYIRVGDGQSNAIYKTPTMKTIKVSSEGVVTQSGNARNHENGVIVVRPEIKVIAANAPLTTNSKNTPPEPMVIADATGGNKQSLLDLPPSAGGDIQPAVAVANTAEPEAKIIRLDNKLVSARHPVNTVAVKKSGPNFIFSD